MYHETSCSKQLFFLVTMPDPIDTAPEHGLYMQEPYADEKLALENPEAEEPFGNEESAEVKYRTLTWWYVLLLTAATIANVHVSARENSGNVESVRHPLPLLDILRAVRKTKKILKWPVMIAETVSLGILSLPSALAALGFLP